MPPVRLEQKDDGSSKSNSDTNRWENNPPTRLEPKNDNSDANRWANEPPTKFGQKNGTNRWAKEPPTRLGKKNGNSGTNRWANEPSSTLEQKNDKSGTNHWAKEPPTRLGKKDGNSGTNRWANEPSSTLEQKNDNSGTNRWAKEPPTRLGQKNGYSGANAPLTKLGQKDDSSTVNRPRGALAISEAQRPASNRWHEDLDGIALTSDSDISQPHYPLALPSPITGEQNFGAIGTQSPRITYEGTPIGSRSEPFGRDTGLADLDVRRQESKRRKRQRAGDTPTEGFADETRYSQSPQSRGKLYGYKRLHNGILQQPEFSEYETSAAVRELQVPPTRYGLSKWNQFARQDDFESELSFGVRSYGTAARAPPFRRSGGGAALAFENEPPSRSQPIANSMQINRMRTPPPPSNVVSRPPRSVIRLYDLDSKREHQRRRKPFYRARRHRGDAVVAASGRIAQGQKERVPRGPTTTPLTEDRYAQYGLTLGDFQRNITQYQVRRSKKKLIIKICHNCIIN